MKKNCSKKIKIKKNRIEFVYFVQVEKKKKLGLFDLISQSTGMKDIRVVIILKSCVACVKQQ